MVFFYVCLPNLSALVYVIIRMLYVETFIINAMFVLPLLKFKVEEESLHLVSPFNS